MRLRRWVHAWGLATCPAALVFGVLGVTPAHASGVVEAPGPDFEMPFACGQQWTGTTRSRHFPSVLSVDFNRPGDLGALIVASAPGVVTRVADTGATSYGRYLILDHGDGHSTLHAHLRSVWATPGQRVDQGTILGLVGDSGAVTGPHLHLEQRLGGTVQPPRFHDSPYAFGTTLASANCPDMPLVGDWDNDRLDEVAVFRRSGAGGVFRLYQDEETPEAIKYGRSTDTPVVGDWDGDGQSDVGVRRTGRSTFLLRNADGSTTAVRLGTRKDVPVTGDWNGDGITEVGVWRPSVAMFRLRQEEGVIATVPMGTPGSEPVTGDWNGDGASDVGVFDSATATFTLRTTTNEGTELFTTVTFGSGTDIPVTGDWDGDGVTDVGTWTPSTATYSLRTAPRTARSTATVVTRHFGRRR